MANTKVCQRYTKVLKVGKLLLLIYSGLYIDSQTFVWYGEKESEVELDGKTGRDI